MFIVQDGNVEDISPELQKGTLINCLISCCICIHQLAILARLDLPTCIFKISK